jgi:RNA polymerase primary sigma factor
MEDAATHWLQAAGRHPLLTPAEELHLGALVRAWQDHPSGADQAPPGVIRRGRRARDRIVRANLRLVAHVAKAMRPGLGRQVGEADLPDLFQAGAMGLVRGAERFDPARGYKFSTFGYWWIRQGISRWADSSSRLIRPPSTHAPKINRLGRVGEQLTAQLGRQPTRAELADALGMTLADVDLVLSTGMPPCSLDAEVAGGDETRLGDLLATPAPPEPDPEVAELHARLAALPPLQARLVCGAWGIGCAEQRIGALAAAEGISTYVARTQLRKAEAALRRPLEGELLAQPVQLSLPSLNTTPAQPSPQRPRRDGDRRAAG